MSRPFSRPRTRIYDVNYNIGENYYRPAIDRLDRKYSGRPLSPTRQTSIPRDIIDRHEKAFQDEDLPTARARASKHITEANMFDSRGGIMKAMEMVENNIDEETASKLQRIRANKKVSIIDDIDMDQTMNNIKARRIKDRADKMLDSVGITTVDKSSRSVDKSSRAVDEGVSYKRSTLKVTMDSSADNKDLTKWSKLSSTEEKDSGASLRAKQSMARLNELEDEMSALQEKAQIRERRAARLRAIVAEAAEESEVCTGSTMRVSSRQKKEAIEY
ncbi:PREDICTED: uncharacterized protein LOC108564226 [Nicrophorus vespilloides]|uniref:Uncharacterized protein LOC108561451 n=1 Tax=Nicrophorus vespilloides TaxID=110193 RepID=A0ABM1MJX9_NICVS|nr:PREDICTED: uncharacterized protein LOC108561451 [Nicrophorus vespilloides]XP_017778677.1 PREDICTED: uncharacterized protein LOC108564226 [Nicrophorus vespilloides]